MKFTSLAQRELNQVSRFNSRGIWDTHLRSQAHARAYMIVISQAYSQKEIRRTNSLKIQSLNMFV